MGMVKNIVVFDLDLDLDLDVSSLISRFVGCSALC